MNNNLKLFAISYITECNNTKSEKKQFLEFIKNASDNQVKHLLINGRMVNEDDTDMNIDEKFSKIISHNTLNEDIFAIYAGMLLTTFLAVVGKMLYNVTKTFATKSGRACMRYTRNEKTKCIAKFKKEAAQKQLEILKQAKSKCSKTKEPDKCIAAIEKKIKKAEKEASVVIP